MKTVFNEGDRRNLEQRLDKLSLAAKPLWGRMDCGQMLAHLSDSLRMALGELRVKPRRTPLRFKPIRHAIIYWAPFPKGAPTSPELIKRRADDCGRETTELKQLIEQLARRASATDWPAHPAFGQLGGRDWGVLVHKHVDHHLRQFGV